MKKLIQIIVFILLVIAFIYLGTKDYHSKINKKINKNSTSDILTSGDSVFIKTDHSKILSKISSKGDFIMYACIDSNKLCSSYGLLINEVAKENNIKDIYYYDIKEDREENNATYQKILSKLTDYLQTNDLGEQDLYAPTLIFFKNGLVYSFDDSLSFHHGNLKNSDILNDEEKNMKRLYLNDVMKGFNENE